MLVIENLRIMDIGDETQADHPVLVMFLMNEHKQKVREEKIGNLYFINFILG